MSAFTFIRSANATAFSTTTYRPTALFVGGTAGIGEGAAGALARATKGNVHIIICGRNKASAERIIATFPQTTESRYDFVECDATIMSSVVRAAADVRFHIGESGTINYIVLSQAGMNFKGFDATSEGIDRKLALLFYSRWKFVDELLPLLERATAKGQEARVLSVLGPHGGGPLDPDDMGLKKNYTLIRLFRQGSTYGNIMVDEYSRRYLSISFIHVYPGWVRTPGNSLPDMPWIFQVLVSIPQKFLAIPIEDSGEQMIALLTSTTFKNGGFYLNQHGGQIPAGKIYTDEAARKALMDHWKQEMAPFG